MKANKTRKLTAEDRRRIEGLAAIFDDVDADVAMRQILWRVGHRLATALLTETDRKTAAVMRRVIDREIAERVTA